MFISLVGGQVTDNVLSQMSISLVGDQACHYRQCFKSDVHIFSWGSNLSLQTDNVLSQMFISLVGGQTYHYRQYLCFKSDGVGDQACHYRQCLSQMFISLVGGQACHYRQCFKSDVHIFSWGSSLSLQTMF